MFGDSLSRHLSVYVVKEFEELNITVALLPPNSTHLTQVLDVAVFKALKAAWKNIPDDWKKKIELFCRRPNFRENSMRL